MKRIDVLEVACDAESTTEKPGRHPNSKPQTRATGSGNQSRFTRDNESSQPPRVRERLQEHDGRPGPSGLNQGRRQPPKGQADVSGGSNGVRRDRWQSRDRTQLGHTGAVDERERGRGRGEVMLVHVANCLAFQCHALNFVPCTLTSLVSTHNVSNRTQERGRYERPAKVITHDSHQRAISSRGPRTGVEQRHTPQAPSPVKVSSGHFAEWSNAMDWGHSSKILKCPCVLDMHTSAPQIIYSDVISLSRQPKGIPLKPRVGRVQQMLGRTLSPLLHSCQ